MQFNGALIKEQGVTFAIVVVKPHVLHSATKENLLEKQFRPCIRQCSNHTYGTEHTRRANI